MKSEQSIYETFFVDQLLDILQVTADEEKTIKAFIIEKGIVAFWNNYIYLEISQDVMNRIKTLGVLLEAIDVKD